MNKKKRLFSMPLNLSTQFLLALLAAAFVGIVTATLSMNLLSAVIKARSESASYIEDNIYERVCEFQEYVTQNHLTTKNIGKISEWVRRQRNVMLAISDGENVLYDSTDFRFGRHDGDDKTKKALSYVVIFDDNKAYVELYEFVDFKYIVMSHYFSIILGTVVFVLVFIAFIRRKVKYITLLNDEVKILECGDLNYRLTLKGSDELAYLAKSIDDMRFSILEHQKEEEQARLANSKLVTAMSHDLRTPLTVLIGLLEIIDGKKYKDENDLQLYITKTKNKAYQIKELSDKIFEYFFAFDIKESEMDMQIYSIDVINTMTEDYIFTLGEKGFNFATDLCMSEDKVRIDIKLFGRVIDNIFSNILKYADKEKIVTVKSKITEGELNVYFTNTAAAKTHKEESTNIGLEVCRNIMKEQGGSFVNTEEGDIFTAIVKLPITKGNL